VRGRLYPVTEDWYEWRQDPALSSSVLVRVTVAGGGRLVISGLRIDGPPTAELLRAIPVGRIEAAANAQLCVVGDTIVGDLPASRRPRPLAAPDSGSDGWDTVDPVRAVRRTVRADATRARGRPDVFYREVADAYLDLAQASHRPASEIADTHGVPVSTAHRWVKEARRRGFLPPGRPGKTG